MAGGKRFVAVFDSGLGGISVLRRLVDVLPHEDFVYVGDSAHNPYGERSPSQILSLSRQIVGGLVREGAKAVVIACNTATSVAAATLRRELSTIPIVGVEPALKPATEHDPHRNSNSENVTKGCHCEIEKGSRYRRKENEKDCHNSICLRQVPDSRADSRQADGRYFAIGRKYA